GRSGGWGAAALSFVTLFIYNWLIGKGIFVPYHLTSGTLAPHNFAAGLTSLFVFSASALAISTSITILMESLNRAWRSESQASNLLHQERDLLEQHVKERTHDLALAMDSALAEINERKHTEALLQESEARFRQIVENASDIIYRTDLHGNFTYGNEAALRLMGYENEAEALGKNYLDLTTPDQRGRLKRTYDRQYLSKTKNTYYEFPSIKKNGEM